MKHHRMLRVLAPLLAACMLLLSFGCARQTAAPAPAAVPLPAPEIDAGSPFGVDKNINMATIDRYLDRDDVAYRDVRMLFDPADYGAIGGEADLTRTIQGFTVVPFPYMATLTALPVPGAYEGACLYTVEWNADGSVSAASPNYAESAMIIEELFPRDMAIFLMCGGGGYAGMMQQLLLHLGYDSALLYNVGGNWTYTGERRQELVVYPEDAAGDLIYATWRADYAFIDFARLHPIGEG